jgi:methanol dehydrogenase (cytochrome c) subunit 1
MGATALVSGALLAVSQTAQANKELDQLSRQNTNWAMQTKDYSATHFSEMYDIDITNVKNLKMVFSL